MTPALRVLYMANDCFDSVDFACFSSARWVSIVSHNVSIRKLVQHKKIMWRIRDARNIFPTLSIILHHHRVYGYFETTHKNLSFICLFWFLKGACQILPCSCSLQRRRGLYLIFVNFGTPPYHLGLYKVHQKVCKFATK